MSTSRSTGGAGVIPGSAPFCKEACPIMRTFSNRALTDAEARQALADACKQVETNLPL